MPGLATLLLTVSLAAASGVPVHRDALLARCVSIPDDAERLACFDAFAARATGSHASKGKAARSSGATPPAEAAENPSNVHSTPAARVPGPAEAEIAIDRAASAESPAAAAGEQETDGQVARIETFVRLKRSNRIRITLDNGQVWQENDGAPFRGNVDPGTEVTITKGRFGGYRMTVPTRSAAIIVRRIK